MLSLKGQKTVYDHTSLNILLSLEKNRNNRKQEAVHRAMVVHASKLSVQEIERREPKFQNSPSVLMALTPALQRQRHYDL